MHQKLGRENLNHTYLLWISLYEPGEWLCNDEVGKDLCLCPWLNSSFQIRSDLLIETDVTLENEIYS